MSDARLKDTNPKDVIGVTKVPLSLCSPIAKAHWAAAQFLGKIKYGAFNWRGCGVRASVYLDAMDRHRDSYLSGERVDPVDGTHHLGNVMACCAILLEAEARGNLVDDRPPRLSHRAAYAEVEATMRATVERYRDARPRHWTIADELPPALEPKALDRSNASAMPCAHDRVEPLGAVGHRWCVACGATQQVAFGLEPDPARWRLPTRGAARPPSERPRKTATPKKKHAPRR